MGQDAGEGAQYLRDKNVPALVNDMMMKLLQDRPDVPVEHLREFLKGVDPAKYAQGAVAPAQAAPAAAEAEEEEGDLLDLKEQGADLDAKITAALASGKTGLDIAKNMIKDLPAPLVGNEQVTALSIEENQFESMDKVLTMKNLTELNISDNSAFRDLPAGFAEKLPNLEKIDAYKCQFTGELSSEITKLPNLKYINFYNNGLLKPPADIGKVESLTELNLASNKIMAVQPNAFDGLKNLTRLALFWNRILRIPSLAPLEKLRELQLNGNQLPEMPEFGVHPNLESINLSENKMSTLHASLFQQPALEEFAAGKNLLTNETLLTGWPALSSLRKIQLPNNGLTMIHPEWLDLPKLVCLELNGNKIASLPDDIDRLQNKAEPLKFFFLAENEISALPPAMANMQALTRLAFKGCPLDLTENDTKTTYEALETLVKAKGVDGKFIDSKRTGPAAKPRPTGPSTLGAAPGVANAGGGDTAPKKKKPTEYAPPSTGEVQLSFDIN
eukprot:TRINITY_DN44866_c0_g1_i1.p1 TRINITY_DN44866_c0_g1~~TRINITY_DN44866_c0_g1_i1.p1  ORF type:complete len:501 (+),score=230.24 TRINITY_DN44866_c0_g1_i1:2-1504(+)